MNDDKIKSIIKTLAIIVVIGVVIYICIRIENNDSDYVPMTHTEELEADNDYYKEEIDKYKEETSHLNSRIEELEKENKYLEEYNDLLIQQLEDNDIEPYEL